MVFGLLFAAPHRVFSQHTGVKYFKNYTREDYGLQPQNWSILQDKKDGIIYIANQEGVLIYDGASWRSINIPNVSVRSIAIDDTGTIYVGGRNEFGRLIGDEKGSLKYESLRGYVENTENDRPVHFNEVWKIHPIKDKIYFRTLKFLFRWDPNTKKIKTIPTEDSFDASFICGGKLFIRQKNIGLMQMVNDFLKPVPLGEKFADKAIYMMAPYNKAAKEFLIATRKDGLYTWNIENKTIKPFETNMDDYLKTNEIQHGIRLLSSPPPPGETGCFALGTRFGGLVIIDSRGKSKCIFDKAAGLQDNDVNQILEDAQGNLWLALEKGISKIEYASPISIYDDRSGLTGLLLSVIKHHNNLYVGTTNGLFSLNYLATNEFRPVRGMPAYCFSLLSIGDYLLAATWQGVFLVRPGIKEIIKKPSYFLLQGKKDKNCVWVGTVEGLVSLYLNPKNHQWKTGHIFNQKRIKEIKEIRSIVEKENGDLWLGTSTQGFFYVDFSGSGTITNPVVTQYYTSHGLPQGEVHVFQAAARIMFATTKGIFRFDKKNKIFIPDFTLGDKFAGGEKGKEVFRIVEDKNNHIWVHSDKQNFQVLPGANNTFTINAKPFLRLPRTQVNAIYPDPGGNITWFAAHDGLIRFDKTVKKDYYHDFPTIIRKVVANRKLIYDGSKTKIDNNLEPSYPTFQYKEGYIRFEFASTFFESESSTRYRYLLEGYDKDWSKLTPESNIDYTNLDAGLYTFKVQAMNIYEHFGSIDDFQFKVLLPWYKTWWAFLSYIFVSLILTYLIVNWLRSIQLEKEKQKLEQTVKERTKELKEQAEKLKEMDKIKSRFFTNISHEFRTPLTLIMSPLEEMISENRDKGKKKDLNLMLRNSQRLLGLIDQLLELSKIESGKLELQACRQNIIVFLKGIVASFEPVVSKNELDLTFDTDEENIDLYFDLGKLEEILFNLLSNAVKFTPPGGKISVKVAKKPGKEENFPLGSVDISVKDTGLGIPMDQVPHVFKRFYQSDITYEQNLKGTGIGLSIAKELVELHHGTIDVHSRENEGTEFIVRLPLGDAHLEPEEIVEPPKTPFKYKTPRDIPSLDPGGNERGVDPDHPNGKENIVDDFDPLEPGKNIILVVEDNVDMRQYIKKALEPIYIVEEAANGQEGMQKAQEKIPDLIISDIMMPEVGGIELCKKLKNDIKTSHIPIVLLTAKASKESIIEGLENADDYITKPFDIKIVCARIKNLIDLRTHMQETQKRKDTDEPVKISVPQCEKVFIKKLKQIIDKNISDPDFNVTQMCKDLDMPQPTLYRKIVALSGESPTEFIRSYRLKRGAKLLRENPNITIQEVAFEVGFSSGTYFTRCFKKRYHQSPTTYQASWGGMNGDYQD
jgi:signal transduction histidine kinase/AraC-like DNA-binding protein